MRVRRSWLTFVAVVILGVTASCAAGGAVRGGARPVGGSDGGSMGLRSTDRGDDPLRSWRWTAPARASVGLPTADSKGIAFTFGHQRMVLLETDGRPRWEAERLGLREVAPMLTADLVVAATDDGVMAFERSSGRVRWDTRLRERANTPVQAGGLVVVSTWDGSLVAVDMGSGALAWRVALPAGPLGPAASVLLRPGGEPAARPALAIVVATWESDDGSSAGAVAVDAATGAHRWDTGLDPGGVSSPAQAGSTLVMVTGDSAAHGLDAHTGEKLWKVPTGGAGSPEVPPSTLGDGSVVVADRMGGMAVVDGDTGAVRWQAGVAAAVVRGSPAGPGPAGRFALGLLDGNVLVAGPVDDHVMIMPSPVSGVAMGPDRALVVTTAGGEPNYVQAYSWW